MKSFKPFIWLAAGSLVISTSIASAEVIFEDNFDSQPDYTSDDYIGIGKHEFHAYRAGDVVPVGWDSVSDWSSPPLPHLEIVAGNEDKTRSGTGKSLVMRRVSKSGGWHGDAQLAKNLDRDYKEIYVKFWIKFQPGWTIGDGLQSKLFRIGSYTPEEALGGSSYWSRHGMGIIWDWTHFSMSGSGLRNALFTGTQDNPRPIDMSGGRGDRGWNANYVTIAQKLTGVPRNNFQLVDQTTGAVFPDGAYPVSHDQVFGDAWHKVEFHLKLNSALGVPDGIYTQWLDDTIVMHNTTVPWLQSDEPNPDRGFNAVKFGGNDAFAVYPNEDGVQEWYAIDDIVVRSRLPLERRVALPEAPSNVNVE